MVSIRRIKRTTSPESEVSGHVDYLNLTNDDAEKVHFLTDLLSLIPEEMRIVGDSEKFLRDPKCLRANVSEGSTSSTLVRMAGNLLTDNGIDELSEDILIRIVSLLTLKEAGQTSVLSKRWRHVWQYVPSLNFGPSEKLLDYNKLPARDEEKSKYFRCVDQVVRLHKAPTIEEFRVQFDSQETCKDSVENWFKFAMEKKVQRLELNMVPPRKSDNPLPVTFPSSFSDSLTSLHLGHVDVNGELLEKLLCVCLSLEYLSVRRSESLVDLKVAGPSLKLKSLRIRSCIHMNSLEISAPNLISFEYYGPVIGSPFKSTPKLVDLFIGGDYGNHLMTDLPDLSDCIPQVEALTLDLFLGSTIVEMYPVCKTLKILDVRYTPRNFNDMLPLCSLLNACELLHKFVFQPLKLGIEFGQPDGRKFKVHHHKNLRVVEIVGFSGWRIYLEFAKCLIQSAVSLEKMIITPRHNRQPNVGYSKYLMRHMVAVLGRFVEQQQRGPIILLEENPKFPAWWS